MNKSFLFQALFFYFVSCGVVVSMEEQPAKQAVAPSQIKKLSTFISQLQPAVPKSELLTYFDMLIQAKDSYLKRLPVELRTMIALMKRELGTWYNTFLCSHQKNQIIMNLILNSMDSHDDLDTFHNLASQELGAPYLAKLAESGVAYKEIEKLILALILGYDTSLQEEFTEKPLFHTVCESFSPEWCNLFIAAGVDINVRDNNGNTPLHAVCKVGNGLLLKQGTDIDLKNNNDFTPKRLAQIHGFSECVTLIERYESKMRGL